MEMVRDGDGDGEKMVRDGGGEMPSMTLPLPRSISPPGGLMLKPSAANAAHVSL
jgi:hypothetical protein